MVRFYLSADFIIQLLALKGRNLIFCKNDPFGSDIGFQSFQALLEVL